MTRALLPLRGTVVVPRRLDYPGPPRTPANSLGTSNSIVPVKLRTSANTTEQGRTLPELAQRIAPEPKVIGSSPIGRTNSSDNLQSHPSERGSAWYRCGIGVPK